MEGSRPCEPRTRPAAAYSQRPSVLVLVIARCAKRAVAIQPCNGLTAEELDCLYVLYVCHDEKGRRGTHPRLGCQARWKALGWEQSARAPEHAGRVPLRQDRQTDGLQGEKLGTKQWVAVLCLAKLEPLTES